ncbi:hypothetical protein NDR87_26220 [Nocardia sp. CDC159]|uniref:Uncharacterized protein n=1 Tax=Nocardia pulmonis TaxID=2951408 RepID=A0A9X2EB82_9NOCA|nr:MULTISPECIES: hypothetical protein [Nocardia]MCM6774943.1 hypothetical protein [Nocardia pulmonis]MCM6789874.1 hypothetical protein [Nocardia sp. CDC159]
MESQPTKSGVLLRLIGDEADIRATLDRMRAAGFTVQWNGRFRPDDQGGVRTYAKLRGEQS